MRPYLKNRTELNNSNTGCQTKHREWIGPTGRQLTNSKMESLARVDLMLNFSFVYLLGRGRFRLSLWQSSVTSHTAPQQSLEPGLFLNSMMNEEEATPSCLNLSCLSLAEQMRFTGQEMLPTCAHPDSSCSLKPLFGS